MSFLKNLEWRFATKKFANNKTVSEKDLQQILKAIRYTPTSLGLQPYHIYVVKNNDLKTQLKPIANNQDQIDTCAYLLVFCAINTKDLMLDRVNHYVKMTAEKQGQEISALANLQTFRQASINKKTDQDLESWITKQAYIALGFAMAAAAELKIDSCPMEGFNNNEMDKALNLPAGQSSKVLLAIGHRQNNPEHPKIRFSEEDLFTYL